MKLSDHTIYLCGPIQDRTDEECVQWRDLLTTIWPGNTLNPLRRDYRGRELENPGLLVRSDLEDIDNSDGLFVYFDRPSVGTSMEIFYAKACRKLPVVVLDRSPPGTVLSAWLVNHADLITREVSQATVAMYHLIQMRAESGELPGISFNAR